VRRRFAGASFAVMIRLFFAVLAALAACAAPPVRQTLELQVPYPADAAVLRADGYLQEAERIAPRVHLISSPDPFHVQPIGNVIAVEQRDGFVLVDSGGSPAAAERIAGFLRQIAAKPVKAIIITHWHGDHALGLRTLLARWPAARTISTAPTQVSLSSPATARFMPTEDQANNAKIRQSLAEGVTYLQGRAQDMQFSERERAGYAQAARELAQHSRDLERAARLAPRETFAERLVIEDADAPVEALFLGRANTDGDAVVWLPRQRLLAAGDIVVSPIPYGFGSYPQDWIGVLNRLKGFDYTILVPGHGRPMRDRVYIDQLIALLADIRAQVAPVAQAPLDEARRGVDLRAHADLFSGGDPWKRRWFGAYWTQPIVASAWREARGEPIVQGDN
jgi:glyoxylase-like metal-dependent hydrolase (beta-lactamase superfamily II)